MFNQKQINTMTLTKRDPFLPDFSRFFDDFFTKDFFGGMLHNATEGALSMPAVNIREQEGQYAIEVAAPGYKKEQFKIELNDNVLSISAEHKHEEEHKNEKYARREFRYSTFKRSFTLPEGTNEEEIAASYEDGILKLRIPEAQVAKKPAKQIKIA